MTTVSVPTQRRTAAASGRGVPTFTRSAPYFAALFLIALVAFWPTYLSQVTRASAYTHLHAASATTWMLMLIVQPLAIHRGRRSFHRQLGRASYLVAPLVVVSMVLLAHSKLPPLSDAERLGSYVPLSLAALFALSYGLAVITRRTTMLHARFMVCTALTLVDPVFVRLLIWAYPNPPMLHQWWTFGLTDLVFLALIYRERHARSGRLVFPIMLAVFVVTQSILLLGLFQIPIWERFVRWFAALPLT